MYSRQALLIFQHMYVGPPLDADLKKITEMLAEVTYDWTPQNDKWLKDRRTRRRSLGGATGGRRLHDEVRWRKAEPTPQPAPAGDAVADEAAAAASRLLTTESQNLSQSVNKYGSEHAARLTPSKLTTHSLRGASSLDNLARSSSVRRSSSKRTLGFEDGFGR